MKMKYEGRILIVTLLLLAVPLLVSSQKLIKGIVIDSASLEGLPGVHVQVINTNQAHVTDANGIFTILVNPGDTLIFSMIGYTKSALPIHVEDEIMFVRMHDENIMLKEIIIRDRPLYINPKHIASPTLEGTKPLQAAPGGMNFAYFTKQEREKRKLVKVLEELENARVYIEVVNDPALKEDILDQYLVTDAGYYELLAYFNEHNSDVMHSANAGIILNALHSYFKKSLKKRY